MNSKDQVFCVKEGEWNIMIDGVVLPTTFNSKGAALAGIAVEKRRRIRKQMMINSKVLQNF